MDLQQAIIHSTAIVNPQAQIGTGVQIGPYSIIGPNAKIGNNVVIKSHVVIDTYATIGNGTVLYPFVSLNMAQDKKYSGEPTELIIGQNTVIREYATLQPGTLNGDGITRVGDNCLLMACTHVAHDCKLGNNIVMSNHATLAGHVVIEDHVIIGGLAAVHQFVRIGAYAIIGGMSGVVQDVIPYGSVKGDRAYLNGLNLIGLKRHNFSRDAIDILRNVYNILFVQDEGTYQERLNSIERDYSAYPLVENMLKFIKNSERSVLGIKK